MKQSQNKSTADKLLEQHAEALKRNNISKAEFEELRKACQSVFTTRNGKVVARAMMRVSGIYRIPKNNSNMFAVGEERGAEMMYLFFVVNMLTPEQKAEIERRD